MKYFLYPDGISVALIWEGLAKALFKTPISKLQHDDMRRAFYIGFSECFKLMNAISESCEEGHVFEIFSSLENEVNAFHSQEKLKDQVVNAARNPGDMPPPEPVINRGDYQGSEPEAIREHLKGLADRISKDMPPGWGFTLLMFEYGENGNLLYISTAKRKDMCNTLRDFLARQEQ